MCSVATLSVAWANCVRLSAQAVGVTQPVEPVDDLMNGLQERLAIGVINKRSLPSISATG